MKHIYVIYLLAINVRFIYFRFKQTERKYVTMNVVNNTIII